MQFLKLFLTFLQWGVGIFLLLLGSVFLGKSVVSCILLLVSGLLLIPYTRGILQVFLLQKFKFDLTKVLAISIAVITCFMGFSSYPPMSLEEQKIYAEAKNNKDLAEAKNKLESMQKEIEELKKSLDIESGKNQQLSKEKEEIVGKLSLLQSSSSISSSISSSSSFSSSNSSANIVNAQTPTNNNNTSYSNSSATASSAQVTEVYYKNCTEAKKAGAAPIYRGEPGYRPALDRDNDGIACEV